MYNESVVPQLRKVIKTNLSSLPMSRVPLQRNVKANTQSHVQGGDGQYLLGCGSESAGRCWISDEFSSFPASFLPFWRIDFLMFGCWTGAFHVRWPMVRTNSSDSLMDLVWFGDLTVFPAVSSKHFKTFLATHTLVVGAKAIQPHVHTEICRGLSATLGHSKHIWKAPALVAGSCYNCGRGYAKQGSNKVRNFRRPPGGESAFKGKSYLIRSFDCGCGCFCLLCLLSCWWWSLL